MAKLPLGTKCKTGQTCPESGVWRSSGRPSTTIPLAKGNKFPPYNNQGVAWTLESYA